MTTAQLFMIMENIDKISNRRRAITENEAKKRIALAKLGIR